MGKEIESGGLAKALTQTLQGQGYPAADASTAHAQRTKNPTSTDDDSITDNTDVTVVVASQSFAGVTVAQAKEASFQTVVAAAVAKKLNVDEEDVTITSTASSKNGKDVVVEYQVTGDPPVACNVYINPQPSLSQIIFYRLLTLTLPLLTPLLPVFINAQASLRTSRRRP